jgi:hypothetical protein
MSWKNSRQVAVSSLLPGAKLKLLAPSAVIVVQQLTTIL